MKAGVVNQSHVVGGSGKFRMEVIREIHIEKAESKRAQRRIQQDSDG